MSPEASSVPTVAPCRSIMLPASFAGCGMLLAVLFLVLVGCAAFDAAPGTIDNPPKNAVLCECTCDPGGGVVAVPNKFITEGRDDAVKGNSTGNQYTLGQQTVGLRFQQLNVPNLATITAAHIQFTAAQTTSGTATLQIKIVNQPDVPPFGPPDGAPTVDFDTIPTTADEVVWAITDQWKANDPGVNPAPGNPEQTPDLHVLLQAIVNDPKYTPNSAVAFIVKGLGGTRVARAFESASPQPAVLTVEYLPHKTTQQFLACADPADAADTAKATAVCQGRVERNVSDLANACHLASSCTCTLKDQDATQFSGACQDPCPDVTAPLNCDPTKIAQSTRAKNDPSHPPVCVANSPLGSLMTGRLAACDVDEASSGISVTVYDEDGKNPHTRGNSARGRVNFVGTPGEQWCLPTDLGCFVGMNHRINVNDIEFKGGVFSSDHVITDLTGVGESTGQVFVDKATSQGTFAPDATLHSGRGTDTNGNKTKGFFGKNTACFTGGDHFPCTPVKISVGGWQSGAACSLSGDLFDSKQMTLHSNLQGRLVNQPPTAIAGDDQQVECSFTGGGTVALDGSHSFDPDNNIVSFGWFKGDRTGPRVGNQLKVQLEQPVSTPSSNNETSYVFKVVDLLGQYDDDTVKVNVKDTTAPTVTAPPNPCAGQKDGVCECTGPAGTPVDIGKATVTDVCDDSPVLTNDAPPLFGIGTTTVKWTATDESQNKGTATEVVEVADRTPPTLTVTLSPTVLWPPDHKLIPITATITVTDTCDPNPTVTLVSITSNEPDNGLGDGDTVGDIQGADFGKDDRTFMLRAERSGKGNGRVYTVKYRAMDAGGNYTDKTATVIVPKSQAASK